jgi:hypothetical protein
MAPLLDDEARFSGGEIPLYGFSARPPAGDRASACNIELKNLLSSDDSRMDIHEESLVDFLRSFEPRLLFCHAARPLRT